MLFPPVNPGIANALRAAACGAKNCFAVCFFVACAIPCFAQTDFTWDNASGGDWFTAANWAEAGGPPGASDTATINLTPGTSYDVTVSSDVSLGGGFTLDSIDATLDFQADTEMLFAANASPPLLSLEKGTLTGPAVFLVTSTNSPVVMIGSAADLIGDFTLNFDPSSAAGSSLVIADDQLLAGRRINVQRRGDLTIDATTFTNNGVMFAAFNPTFSGSGTSTLTIGTGASHGTLVNHAQIVGSSSPSDVKFNFAMGNRSDGTFTINGWGSTQAFLGEGTGEVHLNEGIFSANRELIIRGASFTNTGTMVLSKDTTFNEIDFIHSGGTLTLGDNSSLHVSLADFQITNGAALNFQTGSTVLVRANPTTPASLDLDDGSVTGPAVFEIGGNNLGASAPLDITIGSETDFTGDFTMDFDRSVHANLTVADNQLLAGRELNLFVNTELELNANTFINNGIMRMTQHVPGKSGPSELSVHNGTANRGTLLNQGTLEVGNPGFQDDRLYLALHNATNGVVTINQATGKAVLGENTGEVHLNEGVFTSNRRLVVQGDSFTNTGTLNLNGQFSTGFEGTTFDTTSLIHSGGTINLGVDSSLHVSLADFQITNGAALNFQTGSTVLVRSNATTPASLDLDNGSVTGPAIFELGGNNVSVPLPIDITLGSAVDFTGDFTMDFDRIARANLTVADNQLLAGRELGIVGNSDLTIHATSFVNHGLIRLNKLQGGSSLAIEDGLNYGTLVNQGQLLVHDSGGSSDNDLDLALNNTASGVVTFTQPTNARTRLGSRGDEIHSNAGIFTSNRRLVVEGASFTNTGTMLLNGVPINGNAGALFNEVSLIHSGGTINLGENSSLLVDKATFQVTNGASLDFQTGSMAIVRANQSDPAALALENGSITGPAVFEIIGNNVGTSVPLDITLGSAGDLTGDFIMNFDQRVQANLTVADNQLLAGRELGIVGNSDLTIHATSFVNHGLIRLNKLQGGSSLAIEDGLNYGTLVNQGQLLVHDSGGSSDNDLDLALNNTASGVVTFTQPTNARTRLGSRGDEIHSNAGIFTSNRRLVVEGASFTNTGTMLLNGVPINGNAGALFNEVSLIHSGGTINLGENSSLHVSLADFQITNGAALNFQTGSTVLVRSNATTPASLDLDNGSVTGPAIFELGGNNVSVPLPIDITLGSAVDFTGDFTMDFDRIARANLTVADNQLLAGRELNLFVNTELEFRANTFINNGIIRMTQHIPGSAGPSEISVHNGTGNRGTLLNQGTLEVGIPGFQDDRIYLALHNATNGVVTINNANSATSKVILGENTGELHLNEGVFTSNRRLLVQGDSFTNTGTFNGYLTIDAPLFINNGTVNETGPDPSDTLVFNGPVSGAGSFTGDIVFQSRYAPGNSPAIVNVENITLTSTSTLEMEIGGLTPGTQHDQIVVSGTATLGGRLDIPLINGFQPTLGDSVTIISGGTITGGFAEATSPNPPDNLAIFVNETPTEVTVTFVQPVPENYDSNSGGGTWSDTNIWLSGIVPDTDNNTNIFNPTAGDQTVTVNVDAFANKIDVDGVLGTMTVVVPSAMSLSSINSVDVNNNGVVNLTGGTLLSSNIDVNNGGELTGVGSLVGNLNVGTGGGGESLFKPGTSIGDNVSIEGSYQQVDDGTIVIEVEGTAAGEFDTLSITGNAALGGKLTVVVSDPTDLVAGDMIEIITTGSISAGEVFDDVNSIGLADGLYIAPLYTGIGSLLAGGEGIAASVAALSGGGSVFVEVLSEGDMNRDGVLDVEDATAFALALTAPINYFQSFFIHGPASGDIDDDGDIDFDDIDDFAATIPGMSSQQVYAAIQAALAVPEPTGMCLASFMAIALASIRNRPRDIRE